MGADAREPNPRTLNVDSVGVDELGVVPWPILLRGRIARRVGVRRETAVLWIVLTSLFMVSVTFTILTLSLGRIAADLNTSTGVIAWSITGPMLAFGVVGPVYGKAGDLWGHKRVFVLGMLGAGIFAGLTAIAWNGLTMVLFRVLSSSCGAATGPATNTAVSPLRAISSTALPFNTTAPTIAGMDSMNEKRAAVVRSTPVDSAQNSVDAERDTPGSRANDWMAPMRKASP